MKGGERGCNAREENLEGNLERKIAKGGLVGERSTFSEQRLKGKGFPSDLQMAPSSIAKNAGANDTIPS